MSIKDLTITDQNVQSTYVQSQPDRLTGTAQQNKAVFDAFPQLIRQRFNALLEALAGTGAAGEIPVGPIEGVTAENVQQALAAIQQNLTAYINKLKATTGAAEVGVSTISGISAGNVQKALEGLRAIQITMDSNIQKIMSENGAEAVGVNKISGMQAQNVQKALEELRKAIDDSVSGIIPGGSITADMLADDIKIILYNTVNSNSLPIPNNDCNDIMQFGVYRVEANTQNSYIAGLGGIVLALPWDTNRQQQIAFDSVGTFMAYRAKYGGVWGEWTIVATATPPQEHAIVPKNGATLLDGFKNSFSKDQFGRVLVFFSLNFQNVPGVNSEIFSLPESFRPTTGQGVVGSATLIINTTYYPATVNAYTNGVVSVNHNAPISATSTNLHGFLAIDTGGTQ